MSRKENSGNFSFEGRMLRIIALVPALALFLYVAVQYKARPALEETREGGIRGVNGAVLSADLRDWPGLSWEEKERRMSAAILYFREEQNCAILQSPGHYVVLLDRFFQENPSFRSKNLPTMLRGLAIRDYDFYSGIHADEQALGFLGPELFRKNREARKAEEARLRPVDGKKQNPM